MVYVPDPDEREDFLWQHQQHPQGRKKKDKGSKKQKQEGEVVPPGPVTMVGGQPMNVVLMQPGAQPGGQPAAAPAPAPSAAPAAAAAAAGAVAGGAAVAAAAAASDGGKKEKERLPKGGRYVFERHFGPCSACLAMMTACLCLPCICKYPMDIRTVYIADGRRYSKLEYWFSCGGCGCLCC